MAIDMERLVKYVLDRHKHIAEDPSISPEDLMLMSEIHLGAAMKKSKCQTPECPFCDIDRTAQSYAILEGIGCKVNIGDNHDC